MNFGKTYAVMVNETRHILRDRTTFLMLLFIPAFLMIVFSYSLAVDVKDVQITLLDQDRSPLSRDFVATLSNNQDLVVAQEAENYAQAEAWFDRSVIKALVVIPPGFSEKLLMGEPVDVQLIVDGTDPTTANFAITHIIGRSQVWGGQLAVSVLNRQTGNAYAAIKNPLDLRVQTWYNPTLNNQRGIVPAMLALVLNIPAVAVMSALVREREQGTLEGIFATPLRRSELLTGKILPYIAAGLISAVLCALVAVNLFDAPFAGSFPLFLGFSVIFFFAAFSMALFMAIFIPNQAISSVVGLLVFLFPSFFLSGIFFPISAFPPEMQLEAQFIPATSYVTIVRGIMVKGQGLAALWQPALVLLVLGLSMNVLAIFFFKKKI